ncbi:MAG: iron-containing alcohol dehydrogenase [Fusobacteriaceae bacterium]|jgi:alcohol dehydrogenase class IV|nr:iron-containing alcohol dehydrogenase [Fusobacteriaceae bacterium]
MKNYQLKIPGNLFGGAGSLAKTADILQKEGVKSVIVITDEGIRNAGLLETVLAAVERAGCAYAVLENPAPEPSYLDVETVIKNVDATEGDIILAVGGGSVMDVAKLASVLKNAPYTVKDLLETPEIAVKKRKAIMIPTTCGTGSEATCNAIVGIPEQGIKVGIVNQEMIPDYVILDPEMIAKLPKSIVAATGVDALAHCVECLTSKKANPFSDLYALAGGKLIFENLRAAYQNPEDKRAKENMLLGAFYGGVAITASGTTAVHALSYPLGGKFHIPHGVSNAILFAHVMEFNKDACLEPLARMCDAIRPDLAKCPPSEKADVIIREIADIVKITEIPVNLAQYGVKLSDLDFLVDAGSKVKRLLDNNLKPVTRLDIERIYRKVLL